MYRTLDGTHRDETTAGCQTDYLPLLDGWVLSGYTADARYVGTSYAWGTYALVHSTTAGECSTTTLSSGSCSTHRVVVSGLTYKPSSCATRILISRATTTASITCTAGSVHTAEGCSPCPTGHMADGGVGPCLPTVAHVMGTLQTPELTLNADSYGVVRGVAHVTPLPAPLYEAVVLQYAIDAGTDSSSLSMQSTCNQRWTAVNSSHVVAALPYSSLDEDCPLNTSMEGGEVHRWGTFAVLLGYTPVGGGPATTVMRWLFPHRLRFPGLLQAVPAPYNTALSTLDLFVTSDSTIPQRSGVILHGGDTVYLEQRLMEAIPGVGLAVRAVWLEGTGLQGGPVRHDLNSTLRAVESSASKVRMQVSLRACQDCQLYVQSDMVVSKSEPEARRLQNPISTVANMSLSVLAPVAADPEGPPDPDLPASPPVCLTVATLVALLFGVLTRLAIFLTGDHRQFSRFACMEVIDVITDTVAYILCRGEGDLQFGNDPSGLVAGALLTSTTVNAILLVLEIALAVVGPQFDFPLPECAVPWLACIHLVVEDCFQFVLYSLVCGAQTTEGLGERPAVLFGVLQCGLLILVKMIDTVTWHVVPSRFEDYRRKVATEELS